MRDCCLSLSSSYGGSPKIPGEQRSGTCRAGAVRFVSPNRRRTFRMDAHLPLLASQFSKPSVDGLKSDGYSDFFNFSTGRRAVTSLHTIFTFRPRHDLLQMIYQIVWGLVEVQTTYPDDLQLDFKLNEGTLESGFVWAVVKKDELRTIRDARWDLVRWLLYIHFSFYMSYLRNRRPSPRRLRIRPFQRSSPSWLVGSTVINTRPRRLTFP